MIAALHQRMPITAFALHLLVEALLCQWASGAEIPAAAVCQVVVDHGREISRGSGTLIDVTADGSAGLVVTCNHVVSDPGKVVCWFGDQGHEALIVATDSVGDLAALEIKRPVVQPAQIGVLDGPTTIAGFAHGRDWMTVSGPIIGQASGSGQWATDDDTSGARLSIKVEGYSPSGMSGGGAFNSRGEWCGVLWGARPEASYVSAMPQVAKLLTKCRVDTAALGVDQTQMICPPSGCRPSGRVVIGSPPLAPAASSPRRECACEGLASRLDTFEARIEALLTVQETLSQRIDEIELQPGPRGERGPQGPAGQDGRPGRDATIDDQLIDAIVQRVVADLPPITVNNADYHTGETLSSKQVRLGETLTLRFGQGDAQPAK